MSSRTCLGYFSPNTHLTGEALALYVAGRALPELDAAEHRAALGGDVLLEEGMRQVLPDGGHAELSTHYHRYSTDFYLLALQIARLTNDGRAAAFDEIARRQARYLRVIADDRGQLPLIGDDDGGQLFPICGRPPADVRDTLATAAVLLSEPALSAGPVPEEVLWRCGSETPVDPAFVAAPVGSALFADSGYAVSRSPVGDHLVFDVGRHGYLNGGHAHADALGVVLTVAGRPLLVDPGTATYTMDPALRDRFRSAAMHNTVLVNGRSPSTPDGPFHWRSRTDARCTRWQVSPEGDECEAEHRGFEPLVHVRRVTARHGRGWIIEDRVLGSGPVQATAFWHIHPDWTLDRLDGTDAHLRHTDGTTTVLRSSVPLAPADPGSRPLRAGIRTGGPRRVPRGDRGRHGPAHHQDRHPCGRHARARSRAGLNRAFELIPCVASPASPIPRDPHRDVPTLISRSCTACVT